MNFRSRSSLDYFLRSARNFIDGTRRIAINKAINSGVEKSHKWLVNLGKKQKLSDDFFEYWKGAANPRMQWKNPQSFISCQRIASKNIIIFIPNQRVIDELLRKSKNLENSWKNLERLAKRGAKERKNAQKHYAEEQCNIKLTRKAKKPQ